MTLETKCQNIAHRRFSEAKTYGNKPLEACPFCRIEELESVVTTLIDACQAKDVEIAKAKEPTFFHKQGEQLRLALGEYLFPYVEEFGCGDDDVIKIPERMASKYEKLKKQLKAKDMEIAALEKRIEELEDIEPVGHSTLTIDFVDELPDNQHYAAEGLYIPAKGRIIFKKTSKLDVLVHELGHHLIEMRGGGLEEHESYDDYDCDGLSFKDFIRSRDEIDEALTDTTLKLKAAMETLEAKDVEIAALEKRIEELERK